MATSTARLSPAATILRNSKLFSIPTPLPSTSLASETGTQPFPIHAAIETPITSWKRGDWGLKRSLPLRSTTNAGTVAIRVQDGIDSIEHITDFETAADHVLTLKKWNELNLPVRFATRPPQDVRASVFDSNVDNISPSTSPTHRRWRYRGPWLAGQAGWEFDALLKKVKHQKAEFREFIRERLNAGKLAFERQEAIDAGQSLNRSEVPKVTDEEVDEHMRYLRATPSAFGPLIAEFFDLPEGPSGTGSPISSAEPFTYGRSTVAAEIYKETGPPKTHPSAGISYYASGAHVFNHPEYGPQKDRPPVMARVVKPAVRRKPGFVGIAGFVASNATAAQNLSGSQTTAWQPSPGGGKKVVRPITAAVDSNGRVIIDAEPATMESQIIYGFAEARRQRDTPDSTKARPYNMPRLDEKSTRETKELQDALEKVMRSSGDRDYI